MPPVPPLLPTSPGTASAIFHRRGREGIIGLEPGDRLLLIMNKTMIKMSTIYQVMFYTDILKGYS